MYGGLRKTNTERNAHSYYSSCWNKDILTKKAPEQIVENIANLVIKLKINCDVSISSIPAVNDQYQKKPADLNRDLNEECREKNCSS